MPWLEGIAGFVLLFFFCVILVFSVGAAFASVFDDATGHRFARKTGDAVGLGSSKEGVPMSWTDNGDGPGD